MKSTLLFLTRRGVFKKIEGKKVQVAPPLWICGWFKEYRELPDQTNPKWYVEIGFESSDGKRRTEMTGLGTLTDTKYITKRLADLGYIWPDPQLRLAIIAALQNREPKNLREVTWAPGWHKREFVLPRWVASRTSKPQHKLAGHPNVKLAAFVHSGDTKDWKETVGVFGRYSSRALMAMGCAFAAPILHILKVDSFGVCLFGPGTSGKTSCLIAAASVPGLCSRNGEPQSLNVTESGLEQLRIGHRDCLLPLDEAQHLKGTSKSQAQCLKALAFSLNGGRTRDRVNHYEQQHAPPKYESRVVALVTSEASFLELSFKAPKDSFGEHVRIIDVPVIAAGAKVEGVFDSLAYIHKRPTVELRSDALKAMKNRVWEVQGQVFREFVEYLVRNQESTTILENFRDHFLKRVRSDANSPLTWRIAGNFACIYAGAALAAHIGLAPWTRQQALDSVLSCLDDAVDHLNGHFTRDAPSTVDASSFAKRLCGLAADWKEPSGRGKPDIFLKRNEDLLLIRKPYAEKLAGGRSALAVLLRDPRILGTLKLSKRLDSKTIEFRHPAMFEGKINMYHFKLAALRPIQNG